jgi:hypothetical protein
MAVGDAAASAGYFLANIIEIHFQPIALVPAWRVNN